MFAEDASLYQEESAVQCTVSITKKGETILLSREDANFILDIVLGENFLQDEFKEESKPISPSESETNVPSSLLRITITDNSGRNTHYQLEGTLLIQLDNGKETVLTQEEAASIQKIAKQ